MIAASFKHLKRIVKIAGGFVLLIAGIVMLAIPGPGWITIALGLALLATEFHWAHHLLKQIKAGGIKLRDVIRGTSR